MTNMNLPKYLQDLIKWLETAPSRNAVVAYALGLGAREAMLELFKQQPETRFLVIAPRMLARHTWADTLKKRRLGNVRVIASGNLVLKPELYTELLSSAEWVFVDVVTWRKENRMSLKLDELLRSVKRLTVYRHAFDPKLKLYQNLSEWGLAGPTS